MKLYFQRSDLGGGYDEGAAAIVESIFETR